MLSWRVCVGSCRIWRRAASLSDSSAPLHTLRRVCHPQTIRLSYSQDERSQHKNKAKALKVLRARMFEAEQQRQRVSQSRERKEQIGSGDRSERVRTYNFPQVGAGRGGWWVEFVCGFGSVSVRAVEPGWLTGSAERHGQVWLMANG